MMYVSQTITLYTLNIYSALCQLFLNKPGRKKIVVQVVLPLLPLNIITLVHPSVGVICGSKRRCVEFVARPSERITMNTSEFWSKTMPSALDNYNPLKKQFFIIILPDPSRDRTLRHRVTVELELLIIIIII